MAAQRPPLLLPSSDFPSGSGGWGRALFAEHNCIDSELGRSAIARARLEHFRLALLLFSVSSLGDSWRRGRAARSEEHTSELQSHSDLVCRLLLEKKKKTDITLYIARS